ncbi:hypothetical protein HPP92_020544 [Vanilla planifolia]|uniref:Uncharacterized protein n=1 Tax=Vanilla planifolia TaxID=51239 RepID=A0A835Q5A4_VANPL|nr:hypothetical protein HPP92_020544 [Vanilla planifolia]
MVATMECEEEVGQKRKGSISLEIGLSFIVVIVPLDLAVFFNDWATAINIYYLVANETVDDIIWYLMVRKLKTVRPGKQKKLDSFLKRCPTASVWGYFEALCEVMKKFKN